MSKGDDILDNEIRKMIYNHIIAYPGVSYFTLKKVFDLADGTLRYHLNYLERSEKISFGLEKGKRYYYPNHGEILANNRISDNSKLFELTSRQERLLGTIKRYPGITQKELVNKTGMNRLTIINNLKKLIALDLIRKTPNGNNVYYEFITNEQLRYEILKKLVIKLLKKEITEEKFLKLKRKLEFK